MNNTLEDKLDNITIDVFQYFGYAAVERASRIILKQEKKRNKKKK